MGLDLFLTSYFDVNCVYTDNSVHFLEFVRAGVANLDEYELRSQSVNVGNTDGELDIELIQPFSRSAVNSRWENESEYDTETDETPKKYCKD